MIRSLKHGRLLSFSLSVLLSFLIFFTAIPPVRTAAAPAWPSDIGVEAEGGILIDADSGCVIYGQNIHERFFPASITKILTALIVIENCDPDDVITFSSNAVHHVEAGSTSAGYDTGDQITVRQALYAMLLKSANEVANALAEHCGGSIEGFADMMNEKAASLGCTDSHFVNPSGLNDPEHYTTPYDYALIARAAFDNPTFVEYDSSTYYELPPNATNPDGFTVYCGHKMLKKNASQYYPGIIGGKTGYTTLAGNTLVTCAEKDGLRLITVILNGHQTHYSDTKALLDFGFGNFRSESISLNDDVYSTLEQNTDLFGNRSSILMMDDKGSVTLPKNASFHDAIPEISYQLGDSDPAGAAARVDYRYDGRFIGSAWLLAESTVSVGLPSGPAAEANHDANDGSDQGLIGFLSAPEHRLPVIAVLLILIILAVVLIVRKAHSVGESSEISLQNTASILPGSDLPPQTSDTLSPGSSSVDRYLGSDRQLQSRRKKGGFFRKG